MNEKLIMKTDDCWTFIRTYFKGRYLERLVRHQLESYNNFVNNQLQKTINMFNPVVIHSEQDYDEESKLYKLEMVVTFENFQIYRPQIHENNGATKIMFPQEARLRNFTYSSAMTIDLNIKILNRYGENLSSMETIYKKIPRVHIGKLPIMLKSNICVLKQNSHLEHRLTGECRYDPGGYFIINGSEKTVIAQERSAENRIMCFNIKKGNNKWGWLAEIKSIPDFKCISPKQINMMIQTRNNGFGHPIFVQIPRIKKPVPLFILFRSLGITSDKEICDIILLDINDKKIKKMLYGLKASIVEANKYLDQKSALDFIVSLAMYTPLNVDKETGLKRKIQFTENVLDKDLFPHCVTKKQKIYYLGYMTNKLLRTSFGWRNPDDRDSYINKRIDLTGTLLNNLFRNYFNKLVKDMQKQIVREINNGSWRSTDDFLSIINQTNIYKIIKSTTIENGIKRALATGDFGIKNSNSNKVGVAQVLNRLTYIASLSHLRRVNTPMDKSGKLIPPRKLHPTQWGYICPAETPEGQSVGVVKNLSYLTHITINSNSQILYDIIIPKIKELDKCSNKELYENIKIFINGNWVGISTEPYNLYLYLKDKKYKGIFNIYVSIVFDYTNKEIKICNDAGRLTRPVFRVQNNKILTSRELMKNLKEKKICWDELMINHKYKNTLLEYIDPEEQNVSLIAMKLENLKSKINKQNRYTHCEIHPSTIFGILASCIPFPEHNQSPRNTYQCIDWDECIIMANRTHKKIKDVKIGDKVLTFDPKTKKVSTTEVIMHMNRPGNRQMYMLETITGVKVKATCDHKFMTSEGWKKTEDFTDKTELGMYKIPTFDNIIKDEVVISKENILKQTNWEFSKRDINRLDKLGLFDIKLNNYKIKLIAKMFGFIMTDGSVNIYQKGPRVECYFTSPEAAEEFENDVELLGFEKRKIIESKRTFHGSTHHTWRTLHCGLLSKFFIALDITMGKRTENPHKPIPEWIKKNNTLIKCFLSGYFGGDGCRIRYNKLKNGYNYICGSLQITKNERNKENGIQFMESLKIILNQIKIKTKNIICKSSKQYKDRFIIQLPLSCVQSNLINIFDNIGYSYDYHKQIASAKVITYLKYKKYLQKIYNKKTGKKYFHLKEFTPDKFIKTIKTQHTTLFEPILSIQKVESCMISDLTTLSENHSFILSNNILSSNCAQGKQALGMYVSNFDSRMDKTAYVQTYTMRPLVDTRIMNYINLHKIPSGSMVCVAIMTYSGFNQEDSIILNQDSLDRGLFSATIYHTEKDEDKKIYGDEEIRCKPNFAKTKGMKYANYNKLTKQGIIQENTLLENRDIIMGKVVPIKENKNDQTKIIKYTDESRLYRTSEETFVDKNYVNRNGDGYTFCKVRTRTYRVPIIGDKFCINLESFVLTSDGWVQLKDIDIKKHKVATLKNGSDLDYVHPTDKYEFDCVDEDLYHVQNKQVKITCTKNHKLYVQKRNRKNYEFIEAKDACGKMVRYKKDTINRYPNQEFIYLNKIKYPMNAWLKLLGIYIADGSRVGNETSIKLCGLKTRKKEFMVTTCKELGVEYSIEDEGVRISGVKYPEILDNLMEGKAHNKYLPNFVWKLSQEQSRILMESLLTCDGHTYSYKNKNGFSRYGTVSIKLANDIQKLALHCGWSGIVKMVQKAGRTSEGKRNLGKRAGTKVKITQKHDYYKISIIRSQNNPWVNKKKNISNIEEYIKYTGKVGCIEVPDTHLFYYKEDEFSPPCWTGNSSRHG